MSDVVLPTARLADRLQRPIKFTFMGKTVEISFPYFAPSISEQWSEGPGFGIGASLPRWLVGFWHDNIAPALVPWFGTPVSCAAPREPRCIVLERPVDMSPMLAHQPHHAHYPDEPPAPPCSIRVRPEDEYMLGKQSPFEQSI